MTSLRQLWQAKWQKVKNFRQSKAFDAMFWVLVGTGGYQIIRLASNLILTRLLFPEAFGIMAIVTAVFVALGQISDIGLREGVVNSSRVNEPEFMRTAWTLQVIRSAVIALFTLALAAPIAAFYDEPLLFPVMAVTAITMLTQGFKSIALLAYDKRMDLKTQITSDLLTQVFGLVIIIVWAWISPTIWALVAGHLISSLLELVLSYRLFKGHFSKFAWDKETVSNLFHFGKWILLSSTISIITTQGDKFVMGTFLSMGDLGKYSIAATWASMVTLISYDLSRRVLHPYFRQAIDQEMGFSRIRNMRFLLNGSYIVICLGLALYGDLLIIFLYDDQYIEAGWMLQILALGQIGRAMSGTLMPFLLAKGDSFSQMTVSSINAVLLIGLMTAGGKLYGGVGVILGYSLSGVLSHPVMVLQALRHGYNCILEDIGLMALGVGLVVFVWVATGSDLIDTVLAALNGQ